MFEFKLVSYAYKLKSILINECISLSLELEERIRRVYIRILVDFNIVEV
jgi:hypothetical protein